MAIPQARKEMERLFLFWFEKMKIDPTGFRRNRSFPPPIGRPMGPPMAAFKATANRLSSSLLLNPKNKFVGIGFLKTIGESPLFQNPPNFYTSPKS